MVDGLESSYTNFILLRDTIAMLMFSSIPLNSTEEKYFNFFTNISWVGLVFFTAASVPFQFSNVFKP